MILLNIRYIGVAVIPLNPFLRHSNTRVILQEKRRIRIRRKRTDATILG